MQSLRSSSAVTRPAPSPGRGDAAGRRRSPGPRRRPWPLALPIHWARLAVDRLVSALIGASHRKVRFVILQRILPYFEIDSIRARCGECLIEGDPGDELFLGQVVHAREFEKGIVDLLARYFGQFDQATFIDVGANIGMIAAPVARLGHVNCICFEPHPRNSSFLKRNMELNATGGNVQLHEIALADEAGPVKLAIDRRHHGRHQLMAGAEVPEREAAEHITVRGDTLDRVLGSQELARPICIKMDIQGAEHMAIRGGRRILSMADLLVMEFAPPHLLHCGVDLDAFLKTLGEMYRYGRIIDSEEIIDGKVELAPIDPVIDELSRLRFGHCDVLFSNRRNAFGQVGSSGTGRPEPESVSRD